MLVFWWLELDLVFLVGSATSSSVFWGVCELSMILGSLSVNGWHCVPVLLVVWHWASSTGACWPLGGAGLMLRWRSLGELSLIDITRCWEVSGSPVSLTRLSHLRGSGLIPGQNTKTLSATWLRRKGRKKERKKLFLIIKKKLLN